MQVKRIVVAGVQVDVVDDLAWLCLRDLAVLPLAPLFLLVGVKRIAVPVPHLIMPTAQFAGQRRPVAVFARAPDHLSAPSIFGRSVSPLPFVVHEAEAVSGVLAGASLDRTKAIESGWCHQAMIRPYKILGNGIQLVEDLTKDLDK